MGKKNWWKDSLIYQIYPLSFKDSNGDGIGDINGITSELDYLKYLGVDVIWLSPIYESPMDDNGYDISNYYKINPMFGNMDDFKKLLDTVHEKGMKLIMDLVVNHTSDEHVWFKEAVNNPESKYRDYYIWRKEPSDIQSVFSGPAWEYEPKSMEYYFHLFSKKQPDLNWENEELREEIYKMINYWLDLGIDGFRLDVIDLIGKDIDKKQLADGPYLEERLKEMYNKCFKGRDIMTVGETPGISIKRAQELTAYPTNYLDMVFQFSHISLDEEQGKGKWFLKDLDLKELKTVFENIQDTFKTSGWTSLFWSNHDQPRAVSRYGNDTKYHNESAKMLFTVLYSLKGTAFVYQGEEIGMTSIKFDSIDEYKDIETINMYNEYKKLGFNDEWIFKSIYKKSRDNSRTPIQWDNTINGGFTNGTPWIKVNDNYKDINVKNEINDSNSILNYVKKYFEIRKKNEVFLKGDTIFSDVNSDWLFTYKRIFNDKELIIVANFSSNIEKYEFKDYNKYRVLITNYDDYNISRNNALPPYFVGIYEREDENGNN
ncbi:alpha-glucosidase [Haploplasma axanthum]|uniref:Oligo-1,6-glucosidase n=1 Tax=Haploplasma axanthum TaxID=29552 RepID=A0A449BFH5_HAPAX|nr:alpha-glucosidase [Haploplasma axanthum]VEU81207.1 Oligo-1,6-glucosidase [Haploplasma axanthum]